MKIDFHTRYDENEFEGLCIKALEKGLDALVMTGLGRNRDLRYENLQIFPAQEVSWNAVLEPPKTMEDFLYDKPNFKTESYRGEALVLLPVTEPYLQNYDNRLFKLIEQVSQMGGITISLHDDGNVAVPISIREGEYVYPFDATRVRPCTNDVDFITSFGPVPVAGSNSSSAAEMDNQALITEFRSRLIDRDSLLGAIRGKEISKLYHKDNKNGMTNYFSTVNPMKPSESSIKRLVDDIFK